MRPNSCNWLNVSLRVCEELIFFPSGDGVKKKNKNKNKILVWIKINLLFLPKKVWKLPKLPFMLDETFCSTPNEKFIFPNICKESKGNEGIDSQNWKMKWRSWTLLTYCQRTVLFCDFSTLYKYLLENRNEPRGLFQLAGYLHLLLCLFPLKILKNTQQKVDQKAAPSLPSCAEAQQW